MHGLCEVVAVRNRKKYMEVASCLPLKPPLMGTSWNRRKYIYARQQCGMCLWFAVSPAISVVQEVSGLCSDITPPQNSFGAWYILLHHPYIDSTTVLFDRLLLDYILSYIKVAWVRSQALGFPAVML